MNVLYLLPLAAAAVILWNCLRTRRIMERMDHLLDQALRGEAPEGRFDESLRSRLETKLGHYLSASAASARSVAEEKDKIKTLIADISHQTKTPLANILLYAQLLAEQELSEESRLCVSALEEQTEKLQALIEALVKTSRLETGVLALHPRTDVLLPMLETSVNQFAPRAAEKNISLTLAPTEASAVFDAKWTGEAVCNLLDNAVKYTPAGGSVKVEVISYELFCRVNVIDTGPGIPEAEQARVFARFYRSAAVSQEQGVGIGLYLARQIAEGQGGYLSVFSKPGKGAMFSLYLPRG